jgi:hypothetical protein
VIARLLTVAVALIVVGGSAASSGVELLASVGPGRSISLRLGDGTRVARLKAGSYTFVVTDRSRHDNFHLTGRVDRKTGIAFAGTRRWIVELKKGTYRYRSDAHPRTLRGTFSVS